METRRKETVYGKCRCCNAEGHHRDIMKQYRNLNGTSENYYKMFMECFNLFLSTSPELSKLICWLCINRLRDAISFRSKVAAVEQSLLGNLHDADTIFVNVPVDHAIEPDYHVKSELVQEVKQEQLVTDDYHACQNGMELEDEGIPYDERMQFDGENENSNAILSGGGGGDGSEWLVEGEAEFVARFRDDSFRLPTRTQLYANSCSGFVNHLDMLRDKVILPRMLERLLAESERGGAGAGAGSGSRHADARVSEKMAHIANAAAVLQHSNATPFKSKTRLGFPCYYCRNIFETLDKLRAHQSATHRKSELKKVLAGYGAECLVVYADVTDLKCTVCDERVTKLNELKTHLVTRHNKTIYTEYTDRVVPFKLSPSNVYECQVCGFSFETFGSIERHMNVHYRNYVCNECGAGFVTKYRLKVHTKSMHVEGSHPCDVCGKVFTTQQKLKNHVDAVHKMVKRFKCPKCTERFSEYFKRQKHLVEAHGVAPLQYKCNVCDKAFDRRYTLSRHMKRDHLEERDFQCQLCAYRCFTNNELRVHMIKHNGERVHECAVCKKAYARKKTLREHMRIHNNDRRFACAVCGQAFVQKCSLKGHIKTHHLEYSLQ